MHSGRDKIIRRLQWADRAHQREAGGSLLFRGVKWVLLGLAGCFVLDVFLHLDAGWRLGLTGGLVMIALGLIGWSAYVAWVRQNPPEHIARLLEERDPKLGSQLINVIQLEGQADDPALAEPTRQMARLAVEDYASRLAKVPFERAARSGLTAREFKRAGLALLIFTLLLAAFFPVTRTEVPRFLDPYGDHPPYSMTKLEIVNPGPEGTNVIYGRGFIVQVQSSGHRPKEIFLTAHPLGEPEKAVTLPMFDKGEAGYYQELAEIRKPMVVQAHTKDRHSLSRQARLGVILVPQMEKAFLQISPPAYTGLKPEEKPFHFKGIQALAGSEVRFRLQSNRPLREGFIEVQIGGAEPARFPLARTADSEVTGKFPALDSGRVKLSIVDTDGIASQAPWESALTVTHDLAPEISIVEPERDTFVAMDFRMQPRIEASDDYGLSTIRIHRGLNGTFGPPRILRFTNIVRAARETLEFDFRDLGVQPGDVISLFAEAVDNCPEPHLARSQTVNLMVIAVEEYNDFLRERLDITMLSEKYGELMTILNDLIEEQKKVGEEAAKTAAQAEKAGDAQKEALARELDALLAKQNELNRQLNQQAERMENFVRENPLYDVEHELQKELRDEARQIRESVKQNDADTGGIARRSNPETGGRQVSSDSFKDFKQASDDQVKRLGGVEEQAQEEVAGALEDLSAMQQLIKDFNQFEALYQAQQALAGQCQAYNREGQLSREDQLALKNLAATEKQIADLLEGMADRLREDAKAAEENFPKAARSARDLAEKIEDARLDSLARKATDKMLEAKGDASAQAAERLRSEMEKLCSQCNSSGGRPQQGELDQYLKAQRAMKAGQTFSQMMRTRNFSRPGKQRGMGQAGASGEGESGETGYSISNQQALDVMGNESMINRSAVTDRPSSRAGMARGKPGDNFTEPATDKTDTMKRLNPVNRQSGAVQSESIMEEYHEVVEKYFQAITREPKK